MTATVIARSTHGLEWVCADEITDRFPAVAALRLARREVVFDLPELDPAVGALRTVDDAFLLVGRLDRVGTTKDALAPLAVRLARLPWPVRLAELRAVREIPGRPRFDVVASLEGRRTYNRFAVEDAAGAALAPVLGGIQLARTPEGRPAGTGTADLTVRVILRDTGATVALRLGARPMHRRAYKQDTGPGTLHPPVAAALARLAAPPVPTGWPAAAVVLDPFCGDGTIAVEAALAYPGARIVARDLDPARAANTRRNAARAGVRVEAGIADAVDAGGPVSAVLTNPPWNRAVDARGGLAGGAGRASSTGGAGRASSTGGAGPFWRRLPEILAPDGRLVTITDADLAVPETLRRMGYAVGPVTRIRLAGRVSDVVLAAPPGAAAPSLYGRLAEWRERAITAGVTLHTC